MWSSISSDLGSTFAPKIWFVWDTYQTQSRTLQNILGHTNWITLANSDDEDDLETLRVMQRSFNKYDIDATKEKSDHLPVTAKAAADDSPVQGTLDRRSCTEVVVHSHKDSTELLVHSHSQFPKLGRILPMLSRGTGLAKDLSGRSC